MSLKSTSESHYATSGVFSLNAADRQYWTLTGWVYVDSVAGGDDWMAAVYNSSNNPIAYLYLSSAGKLGIYDGVYSDITAGNALPSGEWVQVAMRFSRPGGTGTRVLDCGMWRSGDANWAVTNTISQDTGDQVPHYVRFPGITAGGLLGRYAYWQFYSGGTDQNSGAYMSVSDLNAQRSSTSAHAAYGNGFREQWKMTVNDATLLEGDIAIDLTNSGMTFDAENPTISAGSSVVPGIWLSRQNRAFGSARQRYT
jgi:hypothetical protein